MIMQHLENLAALGRNEHRQNIDGEREQETKTNSPGRTYCTSLAPRMERSERRRLRRLRPFIGDYQFTSRQRNPGQNNSSPKAQLSSAWENKRAAQHFMAGPNDKIFDKTPQKSFEANLAFDNHVCKKDATQKWIHFAKLIPKRSNQKGKNTCCRKCAVPATFPVRAACDERDSDWRIVSGFSCSRRARNSNRSQLPDYH